MYIVTDYISIFMAAILFALAALHVLWALGSTWPRSDEASLARTVVGTRGITKMPPKYASALVAVLLVISAFWALGLRGQGPVDIPKYIGVLGAGMIAAVFLMRGLVGFLPAMERYTPEQPFLRLNRRIYSPLCLLLGFGFLLLVIATPNWTWRLGLGG